jgi:hypothetical protein
MKSRLLRDYPRFPVELLSLPLSTMVDPRRVPWAFKAELEELYDLLYAPGAGATSHRRALSKVNCLAY